MARKKAALAKFQFTKKARRKNPEGILGGLVPANLKSDVIGFVAPAAGGYVATRIVGRLARGMTAKRWPRFSSKHASPLAGLLTLAGAYLASKKVRFVANYEAPLIAGVVIAVLQSIIQSYFPSLLGLLDMSPLSVALPAPVPQGNDDGYDDADNDLDWSTAEEQVPKAISQGEPQEEAAEESSDVPDNLYTGNFARHR